MEPLCLKLPITIAMPQRPIGNVVYAMQVLLMQVMLSILLLIQLSRTLRQN